MLALSYWILEQAFLRRLLFLGGFLAGLCYLLYFTGVLEARAMYLLFLSLFILLASFVQVAVQSYLFSPGMMELILVRPLSRSRLFLGLETGQGLFALGASLLPWVFPTWWNVEKALALAISMVALQVWTLLLLLLVRRRGIVTLLVLLWMMAHLFMLPHAQAYKTLFLVLPSPYELVLPEHPIGGYIVSEFFSALVANVGIWCYIYTRKEWG